MGRRWVRLMEPQTSLLCWEPFPRQVRPACAGKLSQTVLHRLDTRRLWVAEGHSEESCSEHSLPDSGDRNAHYSRERG